MTNSPYVRSALAQATLELAPPLIRQTLLDDAAFREEYSFVTDAVVSFGDSGVSIQRSNLLNAVRNLLSGAAIMEVADTKGQEWELKDIGENGELPRLALFRGEQRLILPDFAALSADRAIRLRSLVKTASDVNLPAGAQDIWHNILAERTLSDDEVDAFHSEFRDTPVQQFRSIRNEILGEKTCMSSLVPPSRRYFERLVGTYDESTSIRDYATARGRVLFQQLSSWRPYDGFLYSLFLSSHSSLTAEINVDSLSSEDLVRAYDFLENHGDRLSQLGAIEIGFRLLPVNPEIAPSVIRLVKQIRDDLIEEKGSGFQLLSALFVLVDGELARTRLLTTAPPFYRRLAAWSQAALVHRAVKNSAIDVEPFCKWATKNRGQLFYLQSLTDMRTEPRWNPDLAAPSQIKEEFFGRIMIAAKNYEDNLKGTELSDIISGNIAESLHSLSHFPLPYMPGPLEGAEQPQNSLPSELAEEIQTQLSADEVGPSSFVALVNSALIFPIDTDQAELAAKAVKVGSYRLANIEDRSQLLAVLNGLATVAAVTRSHELANELRILVRRYRQDAQYRLSIQDAIRICLAAAASRPDLHDWREFAGEWLTELAFSDLEDEEAQMFHSHLEWLCHVVPELWVTCARVDAALSAFNGR